MIRKIFGAVGLASAVVFLTVAHVAAASSDAPCDTQHLGKLTIKPDTETHFNVGDARTGIFTKGLIYSLANCSAPDKPFFFEAVGKLDGPDGSQADLIVGSVEGAGSTVKVTINIPREQLKRAGDYKARIIAKDPRLDVQPTTDITVHRDSPPWLPAAIAVLLGILAGFIVASFREYAASTEANLLTWIKSYLPNLKKWVITMGAGVAGAVAIGWKTYSAPDWGGTTAEVLPLTVLALTAFVAAATVGATGKDLATRNNASTS
jgi:hypothetical protein